MMSIYLYTLRAKNIFILAAVFVILALAVPAISLAYTRSPGGYYVNRQDLIITTNSADFSPDLSHPENECYVYLVDVFGNGNGPAGPDSGESADQPCTEDNNLTFTVPAPTGENFISIIEVGEAQRGQLTISLEKGPEDEEGNLGIAFVLSSPPALPGGSATPAYRPEVTITSPEKGTAFSTEMLIEYEATDKNDKGGGLEKERLGLGPGPVSLFYSDKIYRWDGAIIPEADKILIAKVLPATGSYLWKIPDSLKERSSYRIIADAVDNIGELGENISELFIVDRTTPVFNITFEPAMTKGENVKITVKSSKELVSPPKLSVTQRGYRAVDVPLSGEKDVFQGTYQVMRDFDGPAAIKISGKDKAGNIGSTIISGRTLGIGIEPPPKPIIDSPLQEKVVTKENAFSIKGKAREDTEVILIQNETKEIKTKPTQDGAFSFDNLILDPQYHKGENLFSIISLDAAGNESQAALIKVKFNFRPEISILFPQKDTVLKAKSTIKFEADDKNDDPLLFTYEIKSPDDSKWTLIASSTPDMQYAWDTQDFADGQYELRVTADDGFESSQAVSPIFAIKNLLPVISFDDGNLTIVNKNNVIIHGKVSTPQSKTEIVDLKYMIAGEKQLKPVASDDAKFNSSSESFTLALNNLKEGEYLLTFIARDSRGLSGKAVKDIIVDFGPPARPVISSPEPSAIISDRDDEDPGIPGVQIAISGSSEPKTEASAVLAGETFKAATNDKGIFSIHGVTLKQHNKNNIIVFVTDRAGNKSPEAGISIVYNNPPSPSVFNPKEGGFLTGVEEISWETKDLDNDPISTKILYQEKGQGWAVIASDISGPSHKWDVSKMANGGDYKIKFIFSDGFGEVEKTLFFSVDTVAPKISFSGPSIANTVQSAFLGQATDDFSGIQYVEYSFNDKDWYKAFITSGYQTQKASFIFRLQPGKMEDGNYKISTRTTDRAGNITYSEPKDLLIDTTPPAVGSILIYSDALILFPNKAGVIELFKDVPYKILFSVARDAKEVILSSKEKVYNISFNKATSLWEGEITFLEPGENSLTIKTQDEMGNFQSKEIAF